MSNEMVLPLFGTLSKLEAQHYNRIRLGGRDVDITINLDETELTKSIFDELFLFFSTLHKTKESIDKEIIRNFKKGNVVNEYIELHLDNIDEEIITIIDGEKEIQKIKSNLLSKIELDKIVIYPNELEDYAIFDYSITPDTMNHVIVFILDEKGQINDIGMES